MVYVKHQQGLRSLNSTVMPVRALDKAIKLYALKKIIRDVSEGTLG